MATVTSCSGKVGTLIKGSISTNAPAPLAVQVGSGTSFLGVTVSVKVRQNVLAQFQNTLSDSIYTTPFGDGPGDIQITFLASNSCVGSAKSPAAAIMDWYKQTRLRPAYSTIQSVTVGSTTFRGFLIGCVLDAQSSTQPVVQGTLVYKAWFP